MRARRLLTRLLLLGALNAAAASVKWDVRANDAALTWVGESGVVYAVEQALDPGQWTRSGQVWTGVDAPITLLLPMTGGVRQAFYRLSMAYPDYGDEPVPDMLTPIYYHTAPTDAFRKVVNEFLYYCRRRPLHHPLENPTGHVRAFQVPVSGRFGAGKGPGGTGEHHPAVDLHTGVAGTNVEMYAAHDGQVATYRDAPKYRHYLSITQPVTDSSERAIGARVTLYAHIDLDLDEADGLLMDGATVRAGELVSKHLHPGTMGGPHLHFEVRFYRPDDTGDETFYGLSLPGQTNAFTEPSAGPWSYGYWSTNSGYGFGDPRNYGLDLY